MTLSAMSAPTDCWLYQGTVDSVGYGVRKIRGKMFKAHRLAWNSNTAQSQWATSSIICASSEPVSIRVHPISSGDVELVDAPAEDSPSPGGGDDGLRLVVD